MKKEAFLEERKKLVKDYIMPIGIDDKRILKAFENVPRHKFVPPNLSDKAYLDTALPIGFGQTISQPSLVALMTDNLRLMGNEKVLEIGTGSGYQAAILSKLVKEVYTVEIIDELFKKAKGTLKSLGYKNIYVMLSNGTLGLPDKMPFDAIIVTAGGPSIPQSLVKQLKEGGRIVMPVGKSMSDQLLKLGIKKNGKLKIKTIGHVSFVPLMGKYGWEVLSETSAPEH